MNYENLKKVLFEMTDIVYRERIVLGLFIVFFIVLKLGEYGYNKSQSVVPDIHVIASSLPINSDVEYSDKYTNTSYPKDQSTSSPSYFSFNPNTTSYEDLVRLGIPSKTAHILINWREKGKVFYRKEDLAKVYGLSPDIYKKLEPYIDIPNTKNEMTSTHANFRESKTPKILDINAASVEDFESLKGIGSGFANSFVKYRMALGGFYSVEQLKEVYHLSDTTYEQIKPYLMLKNTFVQKININTASYETLNAHPYISSKQATEILKERPIYGIDDLYELYFFKDRDKVKKLIPYLEF